MTLSEQQHDELVDLIYKIPLSTDGWYLFAQRLSAVLQVSYVQLQAIDFKQNVLSYSSGAGPLAIEQYAAAEVNYLHFPMEADPRWGTFLDPQRKGWYQCHLHVSQDFVDHSSLYQDILLPLNLRYVAARDVLWDEDICVLMSVHSSVTRQPLTNLELAFLDRLLVHLQRVVAIQRQHYLFSSQTIVGYSLIDKLSQPIVLVDLSGHVTHVNRAAQDFLTKQQKFIDISQQKVQLKPPFHQQFYQTLKQIEYLFRHQQCISDQQMDDGCLKLVDAKKGEILYLFASLLVSEQELKAFGSRPLVMLTLYHPDTHHMVNRHLLTIIFHLTPAEAKVAELLLEGYVLKEIAEKNQVKLDTVRKQLQSIYKKTSTSRQSDLVKLLLNMPQYIANR